MTARDMDDGDALVDMCIEMVCIEAERAGVDLNTDITAALGDIVRAHVKRVGASDARDILRTFLDVNWAAPDVPRDPTDRVVAAMGKVS